jgi:hypothetical protein
LDVLDTTSLWRVEIERPVMEEAPEWLEHDVDELEEEEVSEDVPLPREIDLEQKEDIESVLQRAPPPPQRHATRGRGGRHPTSASTLSQELHLPPHAQPQHVHLLLLEENCWW